MCGLGVVLDRSAELVAQATHTFKATLAHRGPDDHGSQLLRTSAGLTLGLAHRRLSIIDLSASGHQPMLDESGNAILFNGEIYNYRNLANWLTARGERFRGSSDTEVVLRGYRHLPIAELLQRLRGMFALALWDASREKLLLARDPCGIKPLYYMSARGRFACASEVRALVRAGVVDGSLDIGAIDSFLAFGSVQAPLTIYKGIRALLPGQFMWVSGDGAVDEPVTYWNWSAQHAQGGLAAIEERLQESARRHLIADVPVAILLSSGVDSAAIATLSSKATAQRLATFTVGFPDAPEMSESQPAAAIASRLGTRHHHVALSKEDLLRNLPAYLDAVDQPSDDGLNVYLISRAIAAAGIKVALHGIGGDELFGGYPSFGQLRKLIMLRYLPKVVRALLAGVIAGDDVVPSKLANLLRGDLSLTSAFLVRRSLFSYEQRRELLGEEPPLGRDGVPTAWAAYAGGQLAATRDLFGATSVLELAHYAANKLLPDGDVMSMAHGLELRFPLLDVDLIGEVLATPQVLKKAMRNELPKPALIRATPGLPVDLLSKRKRGFTLPIGKWLSGELRSECEKTLEAAKASSHLVPATVARHWRRYLEGKDRNSNAWQRVWALYALSAFTVRQPES